MTTKAQREHTEYGVGLLVPLAAAAIASVISDNWDWLVCMCIAIAGAILLIAALTRAPDWVDRGE